ncbi:hypothetical protein [Ramlibacter sp. PS4R-6]|uniref:hypothetical protein n=1 Tax=Ramlibacter sp. PS4R-6 TaxID=3133438 RepID=UPI0030AB9D34
MPRIAYLSWPAPEFSGGVKTTFRHVELLRGAGFDAVVATPDGKPPGWFRTDAPHETFADLRADDVLVLPENSHKWLERFAPRPNRKLVFCQSWSLVYRGLANYASFAEAGVRHILCPSHTVMQFCRERFPGTQLAYTPVLIDEQVFKPAAEKKLQVMAVPFKRMVEFGALHDFFHARYPQWKHVPWHFAKEASEDDVARSMGESAVFLSMARLEAMGMTGLEAMASDCVVTGYSGLPGGTDSATLRSGFWAREDDLYDAARQLDRALAVAQEGGPVRDGMVAAGRETAARYRRQPVTDALAAFWRGFLGAKAA